MWRNEAGFTYWEALVSAFLMFMLVQSLLPIMQTGQVISRGLEQQIQVRDMGRRGLDTLANELRNARLVQIDNVGAVGVPNDSDNPDERHITFRLPTGFDDTTKQITWGSDIRYQWDAASRQLTRVQDATTRIIAGNVIACEFEARDTNEFAVNLSPNATGENTTGFNTVRFLELRIQVNPDPSQGVMWSGLQRLTSTQIRFRNPQP